MEIWKDIIGYEGLYEVSNYSKIRTKINKRIRKQDNAKGYMRISLYKNGKAKHFQSHRIVAEAFIPNPENKPQVNHKDGVKSNNIIENLEWVTVSENGIHSFRVLGRIAKTPMKDKFGYDHNRSKEINQYNKSGLLLKTYGSAGDAQRHTGICRKNISLCVVGKNKTAGGYKWEYA